MSKKLILMMLLMVVFAVTGFAFEKGTKSVGGSLALTSEDSDSGVYSMLSLRPDFSYFVVDNLALELSPGFGYSWKKGYDSRYGLELGIGARYFYKQFYGGARIDLSKWGREGDWMTSKDLTLSAGRLFDMAKNIYLDLGIRYQIGLGKITYTGFPSVSNDQKTLAAIAGIAIFFK